MSDARTKILLLNVSSTSFFYEQLVIPFGLSSIASYVQCDDYQIKGVDMNTPPERTPERYLKVDESLMEEIVEYCPDILAMSTYATNIYNVLFWANAIKARLPGVFIIVGGNHASYIAGECLKKEAAIDMVARFEGEISFKAVCEKVMKGDHDYSDVPGVSYRANGTIKENSSSQLIDDLTILPKMNRNYFNDMKSDNDVRHVDIVGARGCPYNCTFCNCNHFWNKRYRVRSIDSVIQELKELRYLFPNLKSVRFRDESLTINKKRCLDLSEAIIKNNLMYEYQAHSRLDGLDENVVRALSCAGFKLLFIGMESGSMETLKRLRKEIDISKGPEIVAVLRRYNMKFRISFMSSTYGERFRDTLETVRLIKRLKLKREEYYLGVGVQIYPGTMESERFLKTNPGYEWISRKHKFTGRYFPVRDPYGNILFPVYKEQNTIQTALIFVLLSPEYLFRIVRGKIASVLNKMKY